MKEKDMPSSPEFYFPSGEGEEPMDPDVEPSDEGGEPMDPQVELEEPEIDPDALIEELKRSLEEVKNSAESDSVQSIEPIQEQLSELQVSELQVSKLQAEIRQRIKGIRDAVIEGEHAILLEGRPLAIIRDSEGKLYLVLENKESGFDKLGDSYAHTIDPEQVIHTFNWLKGKKVSNFYDQSAYLKNVAASREEKTA